jgi:predicted esterase
MSVERRKFSARLDCHYLVEAPPAPDEGSLLVVTLHGHGSNPDAMLRLTRATFGHQHIIAAIEAPGSFYLPGKNYEDVGHSWGARVHPAESVRLHHDMVLSVFDELSTRFGAPCSRRVLVGFSQPVSMNYRFAATHADAVRGVIGICGGLPGDWETADYKPVSAAVLHIARSADEYYPVTVTERYETRLKARATDVEFHLLEGSHRYPSKAASILEQWVGRVFGI